MAGSRFLTAGSGDGEGEGELRKSRDKVESAIVVADDEKQVFVDQTSPVNFHKQGKLKGIVLDVGPRCMQIKY